MRLSNRTEAVVHRIIDEACREGDPLLHICTCPLCRADTAALALTNLPPHYVTGIWTGEEERDTAKGSVRDAVASAARRVAACPRHNAESPEQEESTVRIVNFVFEEVARLVLLCSLEDSRSCFCSRCTADMMAYSLNRYPSKYGVKWRGSHNLPAYQRETLQEDLEPVMRRAIEVVAGHPAH